MRIPVRTPTPAQSAPASGILPRNPSLSGLVSSCTPYGHLGVLVPSGDKSHTWQSQLDPRARLARQGAVTCLVILCRPHIKFTREELPSFSRIKVQEG